MKYIAVPIYASHGQIIEDALRERVRQLEVGYHDLPIEEKNKVGHAIHTINGHISGFKQPQYVHDWEVFEKIYYPNKKKN